MSANNVASLFRSLSCKEVDELFDETIGCLQRADRVQFRERQIFTEVLGDTEETREAFMRFLHDVSTCPPEVIQWCQVYINESPYKSAYK